MTTSSALLIDAFSRIHDNVHRVVEGLTPEQLAARLDDDANSIAWLVWHLTRVQDHHVADALGEDQLWISAGWQENFGLPFPAASTGYRHSSADVGAVRGIGGEQLLGYFDAVHERSLAYIARLSDDDLDRVVDTNWNPPVTLAVRLVSVINDDLQHAGQADFVRGALERRP